MEAKEPRWRRPNSITVGGGCLARAQKQRAAQVSAPNTVSRFVSDFGLEARDQLREPAAEASLSGVAVAECSIIT